MRNKVGPASARIHPFVSGVNKLPPAKQIEGVQLQRSSLPLDRKVFIEYTDKKNEWHELELPFLDAMYLLDLLRQIERESGFNHGNEPLPDE